MCVVASPLLTYIYTPPTRIGTPVKPYEGSRKTIGAYKQLMEQISNLYLKYEKGRGEKGEMSARLEKKKTKNRINIKKKKRMRSEKQHAQPSTSHVEL